MREHQMSLHLCCAISHLACLELQPSTALALFELPISTTPHSVQTDPHVKMKRTGEETKVEKEKEEEGGKVESGKTKE